MQETIGVVVATYNGEAYVGKQLESIISQTVKPDLIVVSDGLSKDHTVQECEKILSKSGIRFKLLTSKEQLSVSQNFEKGLKNCDCDYVFFSDQDDVWLPDKIESFMDVMKTTDASFAFANAEVVDGELNPMNLSLWDSIQYQQSDAVLVYEKEDVRFVSELLRRNIVTGMSMCVRKDLLEKALPFDTHVLHDAWIAMIASLNVKTAAISKKMVLYRQHGGNAVGTKGSIKKSLKNSALYYAHVQYRIEMLEQICKHSNINDENIRLMLDHYIAFQKQRMQFMERKLHLGWAVKQKQMYCKMDLDGSRNLIKDYIIRMVGKVK